MAGRKLFLRRRRKSFLRSSDAGLLQSRFGRPRYPGRLAPGSICPTQGVLGAYAEAEEGVNLWPRLLSKVCFFPLAQILGVSASGAVCAVTSGRVTSAGIWRAFEARVHFRGVRAEARYRAIIGAYLVSSSRHWIVLSGDKKENLPFPVATEPRGRGGQEQGYTLIGMSRYRLVPRCPAG